jgi:YD repeat-containing protein
MRTALVLLTFLILSAVGCSAFIVNSGQDLSGLATRSQVQAAFGQPVTSGQTDSRPFEEYTIHRKIAEPWKNTYLAMGDAATLGLGEIVWFPQQLYLAGRRSVVGQHLRFTYDDAGNVTAIRFDGDPVLLPPRSERQSPEQ